MNAETSNIPKAGASREKNLATVVYALQAAGFGLVITYFIAAGVIYFKEKEVAGTWVESHFRWQLNTFWFSLAWGAAGLALIAWPVGYMIVLGDLMWVVFRIVQGWSRLNLGRPMYSSQNTPAE